MPRSSALLAVVLALGCAQAVKAAAPYRAPRTPDGQPSLEGMWTNATVTPLQRPQSISGLEPTQAEADAYLAEHRARSEGKTAPAAPGEDADPDEVIGSVQSEWHEGDEGLMRIDGRARSSLIVEPADGHMPLNLFGRRLVADALRRDSTAMDDPEDRMSDERCLMPLSGMLGPPMLPSSQNGHYQIIQTPGLVAIHTEMIHDVRLVRLNARHTAVAPRWAGDSVGRWEGDTLVVETTGQHPLTAQRFLGSGIMILTPAARVTERFTRVSPTEIRYAFEVEDPAVYTRPWRGEVTFRTTTERMYEYACHEGNYALRNILAGARRREQDEAKAKPAAAAAAASATTAPN